MSEDRQAERNETNRQWAESLSRLGKQLLERSLAWGNSGNLSARPGEDWMLMTATGTQLGDLAESDFVQVDVRSGRWVGDRKPSKEIPMHAAIYRRRADARVVIHASPFWSTLIACSQEPVISECFIESMYYVEKVGYVDYHHPGSEALGDAVYAQAGDADVLILKNHGVLVFDESVKEALMRLETLEMTCRMLVTAKSAGIRLNALPAETAAEFLDHAGYKPRKIRRVNP